MLAEYIPGCAVLVLDFKMGGGLSLQRNRLGLLPRIFRLPMWPPKECPIYCFKNWAHVKSNLIQGVTHNGGFLQPFGLRTDFTGRFIWMLEATIQRNTAH